jgi:HPt (histidine-containing phosphotransfer) domain-containing protein
MKTDLTYLREMSGGNKELVKEMISIFNTQVKEFSQDMDNHLAKKEYDLLGKLAHKAKSSISIMGLDNLAKELKNLENLAREGKEKDKYQGIISLFKQETKIAVEELNAVLQNIDDYF